MQAAYGEITACAGRCCRRHRAMELANTLKSQNLLRTLRSFGSLVSQIKPGAGSHRPSVLDAIKLAGEEEGKPGVQTTELRATRAVKIALFDTPTHLKPASG